MKERGCYKMTVPHLNIQQKVCPPLGLEPAVIPASFGIKPLK